MDDDTRALLEAAKAEVNEEKLAEAIASAFLELMPSLWPGIVHFRVLVLTLDGPSASLVYVSSCAVLAGF